MDLLPDLLVPRVAPAQFTLVEPHLDAERTQRISNPSSRLRVLGCVGGSVGVSDAPGGGARFTVYLPA